MFFQKSNTPRSVLQKALFSVFVFWGRHCLDSPCTTIGLKERS